MNIFGLGPTELIIILVIILILFGPKRLPQLGKSLGKTMKAIREGAEGKLDGADDDDSDAVKGESNKESAEVKAEPKKETDEFKSESKPS